MNTVVVRHEQIGTYEETGTYPNSPRIVPLRYNKPADFGSQLVVLTLAREVAHLLKVWSADDSIGGPLKFRGALYIRFPLSGWKLKVFHQYKVIVGEPTDFISEPVCETKGEPKHEYKR